MIPDADSRTPVGITARYEWTEFWLDLLPSKKCPGDKAENISRALGSLGYSVECSTEIWPLSSEYDAKTKTKAVRVYNVCAHEVEPLINGLRRTLNSSSSAHKYSIVLLNWN